MVRKEQNSLIFLLPSLCIYQFMRNANYLHISAVETDLCIAHKSEPDDATLLKLHNYCGIFFIVENMRQKIKQHSNSSQCDM